MRSKTNLRAFTHLLFKKFLPGYTPKYYWKGRGGEGRYEVEAKGEDGRGKEVADGVGCVGLHCTGSGKGK